MGQGTTGGDQHGQYGQYGRPDQYGRYGQNPQVPGEHEPWGSAPTPPVPDGYGQWGSPQTAPIPGGQGQYGQYGGTAPIPGAQGQYGPDQYGQYGAASAPGEGSWIADNLAGGQPGIIPLRPLRIGEILEGSFRAVRHNPRTMFFYAGVVSVLTVLLTVAVNWTTATSTASLTIEEQSGLDALAQIAIGGVSAITTLIATGALVVSVSRSAIGERVSIGQVWHAVKGRLVSLVGLSVLLILILYGLLIVTAILAAVLAVSLFAGLFVGDISSGSGVVLVLAILLVLMLVGGIPALVLATRLSIAYPAVVLEKARVGRSMSRSWTLTRGSTWRLLGLYLLTIIIAGVVGAAVVLPINLIGSSLGISTAIVVAVSAIASVLANLIVTPFTAGVLSLAYIDQRMRLEGLDVQLARASAARA